VGAIDPAAALGQSKKWAHGHGRQKREKSIFSILVVISPVVGTISGKSLKLLPPDVVL